MLSQPKVQQGHYGLDSRKINSSYRPEIDGIRAFAIIAVIINHFSKEVLPSGYLGVDIFGSAFM